MGMVHETLPAIICLGQSIALDHGPHRAIKNRDALGEQLSKRMSR